MVVGPQQVEVEAEEMQHGARGEDVQSEIRIPACVATLVMMMVMIMVMTM